MKRDDYIGGSDARRILEGDWHDLYLEKIGEKKPEDLTANFPVQLGTYTESFHLAWLNRFCGFDIVASNQVQRHPNFTYIGARLDGWCRNRDCLVELKHSNSRANRDSMIEWYQPQMAHMCNVTDSDSGIISYIAGNQAPEFFTVEPSHAYRKALLDMEHAFWWHVLNREPPNVVLMATAKAAQAAAQSEAQSVRIDNMRAVDMTFNNEWAVAAIDYVLNEPAAASFEKAKKVMKGLVEPDVRLATGHGVVIKRSKSGSLLFSNGGE